MKEHVKKVKFINLCYICKKYLKQQRKKINAKKINNKEKAARFKQEVIVFKLPTRLIFIYLFILFIYVSEERRTQASNSNNINKRKINE